VGRALRLLGAVPSYARIAWWGLASPRFERGEHVVHQAVILGPEGVILTLRRDLRGWELPGGAALPGEDADHALCREVREETGLEVEIVRRVGDYVRSGFRPHCARVQLCRVRGGALRPSAETPAVEWFDPLALPRTLLPWYRGPLADALDPQREPVLVRERQGWGHILAGLAIDLVVRWRGR
jgi:8-oxo-dGTP diphosphatase